MPKYSTEIRTVYGNPYIKVFLADNKDLPKVQTQLKGLQSIKNVNISNENRDLTVYPKPPFNVDETKKDVEGSLASFYSCSSIDNQTIKESMEIRDAFSSSSKVRKCYNDAIGKMAEGKYDRNSVDDVRLALELYLKEVLGNNKPLEKQNTALKEYLADNDMSEELINTHTQSLFNLCNFFNNHTKHDYNVKREEADSAIGYTNQIMKSLLKIEKK
jgi:hypothetical protein